MRYRELRRKLRKLGCEPLRQAGGSHEIWWRPETDLRTVIPNHLSKEIPKGTLLQRSSKI
ncbi:MAG: type II toxin-antitoxin system HicA family toxin [Anaerolineae bacterium]|nr:type II toxin-antitoxin system HicA family toxin [Anaerolineae bacterium]